MATIQLIVMGVAERGALANSLRALFPPDRGGEAVHWAEPFQSQEPAKARLMPLAGLTSPNGNVKKFAGDVINNVRSGRNGVAPDLVLAIGDVELHNLGQEHLLVDHLRWALAEELIARGEPHLIDLLRTRCAYHLLRPMVEAPFFGCGAALAALGLAPDLAQLAARDVEAFESVDPLWLPHCRAKDKAEEPWWHHERHAKHYLNHLKVRATRRRYREARDGVTALRALSWEDAVDEEPSPYLRALFHDLAAWFGVPSPLRPARLAAPLAPTHPAATSASARLLRNL